MRYVAAYCLAALKGSEPTAKDLEKILGSVGVDCDAADSKKVVDQLKGKKLDDIIAEGMGKLGSMPASSGAAASAPAAAATTKAAAPAEKKEEKKEEPEEESDEDMGFGLFD